VASYGKHRLADTGARVLLSFANVIAVGVCRTVRWLRVCGIIVVLAPILKMKVLSRWGWHMVGLRIGRRRGVRVLLRGHFFGKLADNLGINCALHVVGDRALLKALSYFVEAFSTTLSATVVVAELTEGVNGCQMDATVLK
jgi:hypothetical protein